ncbi:MAG TPA: MlaD family protein, partial [Verrucomicrobiae bacterium]|nr:MlaD family protein [Verrucomicrobiae bacterium]
MSTARVSSPDLPVANTRKHRATLWLIWLAPVLAAAVAGFLVYQNVKKLGPTITIQFEDGGGIQANQTLLRYRGVPVGSVKSVRLTKDSKHVEVTARLDSSAASLARDGTVFWVVRPEVGSAGLHGLETIVSGVYIRAQPARGNRRDEKNFIGAEEAPILRSSAGSVGFVLRSPSIASLSENSPIYYRGMEVGLVQYLGLSADSSGVDVHVLVKTNFAPLVRTDTVWWNAGGIH